MDPLTLHPWLQIIAEWGSGPLALGLVGVYQWSRDRKDRLLRLAFEQKRDRKNDEDARDAALDDSFHRLSKDQQDFILNLRQDRDALRVRCDELEAENRRIHETIWRIILHDRDMRNGALNARVIADQQAIRLNEPRHAWPDLPEWNS